MAESGIEINLASLKLVKTELQSAIDTTTKQLEKCITDRQGDYLDELEAGLKQISGTLSLVQLTGADVLAKELALLVPALAESRTDDGTDAVVEALAGGLFVLPRYIEYVLKNQLGMPALLIPSINDVRSQMRQPFIAESYFYHEKVNWPTVSGQLPEGVTNEERSASIKRFRHMYQVGLLSILQGKPARVSFGMMQRALQRLFTVSPGMSIGVTWQLGDLFFESLMKGLLTLTPARKRLLGAIDREIKSFQINNGKADQPANEKLHRELLYLITLSQPYTERVQSFIEQLGCTGPGYSDAKLREQMDDLRGPNNLTVSSVSAVLQDELRAAKEILELASQAQRADQVDLSELISILKKVADILPVVGLTSASAPLRADIDTLQAWQKKSASVPDLLSIADTLLYVESRIAALDKLHLTDERTVSNDVDQRKAVTSQTHYAEAQQVVLTEIEAGLSLIKRALNSFAESNYDRGHIKNVVTTLTHIRGGMAIMQFHRAAKVAEQCANFIEYALMSNDQPAVLQQLLETFADAVISLEYYINAIQSGYSVDEKVLEVAEESLAALGYSVT